MHLLSPPSLHAGSNATNSASDLFGEFITKIPGCLQAVTDSLTSLHQCYNDLQCDNPAYIVLRTRLYSEATMYHRTVFPQTIGFMQDLKNLLSIYPLIENDAEFAEAIQHHIDDIRSARADADELRRRHNFVLANLQTLEHDILRQQREFHKMSISKGDRSKSATLGSVAMAGTAAGCGVTAASLASTGATTALGFTAGASGIEALFVSAAAPVVWPLLLVGGMIGGLAIALGGVATENGQEAARFKAAAISTKTLHVSLGGFSEIVESGSKLLDQIEQNLNGMDTSAKRAKMKLFLKDTKRRIGTVLALCEEFISSRQRFEVKLGAIRENVKDNFRRDWQRRLTEFK